MSLWDKLTGTTKQERQIQRIISEPSPKTRRMERKTGKTQSQRCFDINPKAEVPAYIMTEAEDEVWRENGDWWNVDAQRDRPAHQWELGE